MQEQGELGPYVVRRSWEMYSFPSAVSDTALSEVDSYLWCFHLQVESANIHVRHLFPIFSHCS